MAALSYSVTFNVDSYYNGTHYSYAVTKAEGAPKMIPLHEGPTEEPDGLKLSVPIKVNDIEFFLDKASSVYKFFDTKPMLNTPIDTELHISYKISDDWFIIGNTNNGVDYSKNYVLMANIIYAIPSNNQIDNKNFRGLVMVIDNGSVSYNPGRESLSLDSTTIETINQKFKDCLIEAKALAEEDIQDQPNDFSKYQLYQSQCSNLPRAVTTGVEITDFFTHVTLPQFRYQSISKTIANKYSNAFTFKRKPSYGKMIRHEDGLRLSDLSNGSKYFLLLDVKSGFNDYVKSNNRHDSVWFIARANDKVDMDLFISEATRFVNDIGLPTPTPISTLLPPPPTKEEKVKVKKAKQEAIQISNYLSHDSSFGGTHTAHKDTPYVYVELSHKTSSIDHLDSYVTIIKLRKDIDPNFVMPTIVGVQKGYMAKALKDDNFTEFMEYFNSNVKDYDYRVKSDELQALAHSKFTSVTTAPAKIMKTLTFLEETQDYIPTRYLNYFNTTMVNHTLVKPPYTREEIIEEYPLLDTFYNRYGTGPNDFKHYMELLYELEILSGGGCNNIQPQG